MNKQMPVLDKSGSLVGYATSLAHKQAAALAGSHSVRQEFRDVAGRRRLCWIPAR